MANPETLFREEISKGDYAASVFCSLEIEPKEGRVELISEIVCRSPEGEERFSIKHQSSITNSLAMIIVVGVIKSKYAICVAGGVISNTTKEIYIAYSESNLTANRLSLAQRTKAFGAAIKGRKKNLEHRTFKCEHTLRL